MKTNDTVVRPAPFRPETYAKPLPDSFQIPLLKIEGDLGRRAEAARRRSGLSKIQFITACITYALDHMEG